MKPFLLTLIFLTSFPLVAQQVPGHAFDGGTQERVQSVYIPPITNAPFSATVVTEWTRILPDGSKQTMWNHRLVARDSSGRIFQERRYFSPTGQKDPTRLSQLQFDDPNRHERILCVPSNPHPLCHTFSYTPDLATDAPDTSLPALTTLPNKVTIQRENLGRQTIESVDAVGSREITTIPAGLVGNEKLEPVIKEFWFSPRLGINLITKRFDPRVSSIQNFTVSQINLSEPDPKLFTPPADARVLRPEAQQ
jgi:hypothetical protein